MIAPIGALCILAGAALLYLASPNQRATARTLPRRLLGWSGALACLAGLVLMLRWAGPATAMFLAFTLAMLVWTVLPLVAAWLRRPKEPSR